MSDDGPEGGKKGQKHVVDVAATSSAIAGASVSAKAYSHLPSDHPFYALVGRVASEWAHLEHALDTTIWALAGGDDRRLACITAQIMGVGPRCKAIIALATLKGLDSDDLKLFRN